ncbi:MAG: hypothetical protein VYA55_09720 [Pseudomonadota bacterium]|nr:hypothetical protein [Pseudomonadota bacterium]
MAKKRSNKSITYRGFFHLPDVLIDHPDYIALSDGARSLLTFIGRQYRGHNNGDLQATMSFMKKYGYTSNRALTAHRKELIERNWIIRTRMGGLGMGPDLFAITWQPIDECKGKLDMKPTLFPIRSLR